MSKRESCRSFASKSIEPDTKNRLVRFLAETNLEAADLFLSARFHLVTRQVNSGEAAEKLGTYGAITGADSFIVGITDRSETKADIFGYLFEKIILFAVGSGLATCWLGGFFNRDDFQSKAGILPNEYVPIISPVGYARDRRTIADQIIRRVAGSHTRKNWDELFFKEPGPQPLDRAGAEPYALPLEMVRLAPSASNKQPWRVIWDDDGFHFFLARTRGYLKLGFDMQLNDIGIAKCHFELAAQELKLPGRWRLLVGKAGAPDLQYIISWTT